MLDVCNRKSINQRKEVKMRLNKVRLYKRKLNKLLILRSNRKKKILFFNKKLNDEDNINCRNLEYRINKLSRNYTTIDMECKYLKNKIERINS